jgi:hypothetical protein
VVAATAAAIRVAVAAVAVDGTSNAVRFAMKTVFVLFGLLPNLLAMEITTLDGKTYKDCQVSKVYPDSICVLFSGSGARIKFTNLPESIRAQYGYNAEQAADFEQAEASRLQREQAILAAQRAQSGAQKRTIAANPPRSQMPSYGNTGAEQVRVSLAAYGGGQANQFGNQTGSQFGNQFGNGFAGAQYVGVRMAGPGGIRGVTSPYPTQARPPGTVLP